MNVSAHSTNERPEMERTDETLMMAYQQGDERALEILLRRYADRLLGYLIRMTRDYALSQDLFQETFIRVHKKAHTFKATGTFKPWVFAIATHLALDSLRKKKRRPITISIQEERENRQSLDELIASDQVHPADHLMQADLCSAVRHAVAELPPRQRATLMLAYFEDLPYREVAATLGCSVGTVKTQVSRALRVLARVLPGAEARQAKGGVL